MFSDTTLLAVVAGSQFLLAVLGFVVSLRPLTKRWMRRGAICIFIVAGLGGIICTWRAGVSADRQQAKARAEQSALQTKVDRLLKGQATSTSDIAAVKRQTAPLGMTPLDVRITNPEVIARQTEEPKPRESGPLRWFQKEVHPSYIDAQTAVELTIQADRELPNATIEVVCDAPILGDPQIEAAASPTCQVNGIVAIGDRTIRFTVVSPTLSEGQAYKVTLESGRRSPPISVSKVRKVQ